MSMSESQATTSVRGDCASLRRTAASVAAAAGEVTDELVDAVTLTGPPKDVAAGVARLARAGITQLMIYPMAPDGRIDTVIERFQTEVMPCVQA